MNHKRVFLELTSLDEITDDALENALERAFPRTFIKLFVVKDATDRSYRSVRPTTGQYVVCDGCGREYKVPQATWAAHAKDPKSYRIQCPSCSGTSWHIRPMRR